jgi:bacteriorhodopsin
MTSAVMPRRPRDCPCGSGDARGVLAFVRSNGFVPRPSTRALLYYLRYPSWLYLLPMLLFAGLPALMLAGQGMFGGASLVVMSNIYAVIFGQMLLARKLLEKGKVDPEDLA